MAETRVACTNRGCRNTILPATAARTGGICRPCEQEIARKEHAEYVRANRREVDPFAGVTDPVEIVKLLLRPRNQDELVVEKPFSGDVAELFAGLSRADAARMIDLGVENEDVALWLAAFTDAKLDDLQRAWVEGGEVPWGLIFRGAPADVRDRLIEIAGEDDSLRNRALIALACIGDQAVVERFAQWRQKPPQWARNLYVPPHKYAHEGGWEVDERGGRRDLFLPVAYALVKGEGKPVVQLRSVKGSRCGCCRKPLRTLLQLDPSDERIEPLGLPESVATCLPCAYHGTAVFVREGRVPEWHPKNDVVKGDPHDAELWPESTFLVLGPRRDIRYAASEFLPVTFSQIGGLPAWIQDAYFPECPDCGRTMIFVAQVAPAELADGEGNFYVLWCGDCRVTATTFSQS